MITHIHGWDPKDMYLWFCGEQHNLDGMGATYLIESRSIGFYRRRASEAQYGWCQKCVNSPELAMKLLELCE
jgi:hypothetical protein